MDVGGKALDSHLRGPRPPAGVNAAPMQSNAGFSLCQREEEMRVMAHEAMMVNGLI